MDKEKNTTPETESGTLVEKASVLRVRGVSEKKKKPEKIAEPEEGSVTDDIPKGRSIARGIAKGFLRGLLILVTFIVILFFVLLISLSMIHSESFPTAMKVSVTTFLETGQMKFILHLFLSNDRIKEIVDENSLKKFDEQVDSTLIKVERKSGVSVSDGGESDTGTDEKDIEIRQVSGPAFFGTMMIVKDPSRVSVATIFPWRELGITLGELVKADGALGGINGGLYASHNNTGGSPYGVVVSRGEIQYNVPELWPGLVLVGFTEDDILQIISIDGMKAADVEKLVRDNHIRDAVTFQEEMSDSNNHFVQLIINGEAREVNGMGSGLNPRTAIGQRSDGAVLMFVTDGRGKNGHLGASASDLINVMTEFGAVNAANLDGGSSSCMYYEDSYLMTSVTFYYTTSSWRLPTGFVIH